MLCEDPDAPGGSFLHWLVTGIDPRSPGTAEGEPPPGGREWPNGFGRLGWGGPMPPSGHGADRHFFRLWPCRNRFPCTANQQSTQCIAR
nr:hypothetical protein [Streptomyces sp. SID8354]